LYYRLHVVPIHLPPLSERIEDVIPLAEYFLRRCAPGKMLAPDAANVLMRHTWAGNVRELKNAMERSAVMVRGDSIRADDLSFLIEQPRDLMTDVEWPEEDLPRALARLEETLIRRALKRSQNNRTEAARRLNVNRQLLYAKIKRYGIDVPEDS
jgi:DNA-binding NtrC family response regulator